MTRPKILVTGATGKTGAALITQLRERDWPVRAMVHSENARSERLRQTGAEVVVADLFDPEQTLTAMRGTQRAYFCPPSHPHMIQAAAVFASAAQESKLEAVVGLSQWTASPDHPSLLTRQLWLVERMLSALPGIAYVNLNPGYFADNYLRLIDLAALLRVFPVLTGESRNAPPSNEDIARVAAALLMDPERHAGKSYRPTGPSLLSAYDMVEILRKVLGHRVLALELPFWMLARAALMQGVGAFELLGLRHYIEDHKQGAFEFGAPNDVVRELTGRPAEDFETIAWHYAAMPFAQRTWSNRLRAFLNFARVPFTLGYDLDGYDRRHSHPVPQRPRYAMASETWKAEHTTRVVEGQSNRATLVGEIR